MKNFKKIVATTLCGIMALSLTACSEQTLAKKTLAFFEEENYEQKDKLGGDLDSSEEYAVCSWKEDSEQIEEYFQYSSINPIDYDLLSIIKFYGDNRNIRGQCLTFEDDDSAEDYYDDLIDQYKTSEYVSEGGLVSTFFIVEEDDTCTYTASGHYYSDTVDVREYSVVYLDGSDILVLVCYNSNYLDDYEDTLDYFELESPAEINWSNKVRNYQ